MRESKDTTRVRVFCSCDKISIPEIGLDLSRHEVLFMPWDSLMSNMEARSAINDGRITITVLESYDMTKKKTSPQFIPPYVRKIKIPLTPHPSEVEAAEKEKEDKVLQRIDEKMSSMEESILSKLEGFVGSQPSSQNIDLEALVSMIAASVPKTVSVVQGSAQDSVNSDVSDDVPVYIPSDLTSGLGDQEIGFDSSSSEDDGTSSAASKLRNMKKGRRKKRKG